MQKDRKVNEYNRLPASAFYILEDYLRVHLHPALKRFHASNDSRLATHIRNMVVFLEALGHFLRANLNGGEGFDLLDAKWHSCGFAVQKMARGYKILVDRVSLPANPEFIEHWNLLANGLILEAKGEVMIKLFGIPNCDKIRKARRLLEEAGVSFEFINLREHLPADDMIERWFEQLSDENLINKRSTTFRGLPEHQKDLKSRRDCILLVKNHPTLIQRPLFEWNSLVQIGLPALKNIIKELS